MKRRKSSSFKVAIISMLIMCLGAAGIIYIRTQGSKERMDLGQYYDLGNYQENAVPLVINTELYTNSAFLLDGEMYIEQSLAYKMISSKLYWAENFLIVTTPTDIITVKPEEKAYSVNGKSKASKKVLVKRISDSMHAISLSFIKEYVNVEFEVHENPTRVVIKSGWGKTYNKVKVEHDDVIRYKADKKSAILADVKENDILYVLTENVQSYMRYIKVMTIDGITGYVLNKNIGKTYEEVMKNDYKGPEYTPLHMDKKISLGWLQVGNRTANNNLRSIVSRTSGVNVVSPTWFSLADSSGEITSFASKDFVTYAHGKGIKVWALIDDFSQEVKLIDIISNTEARTNFIKNIVVSTLDCGADGINIDFEHITPESSPHYLQFLRELRIKAHKNKLVLSTDSYIPLAYNEHYKIDEQNEFVDYVIIMAYDEYHSKSTESGSVASIKYTQTATEKALEKVDKEKLIIGVPFYTRLWGEKNGVIDSIETLGMEEAYKRVTSEGGTYAWDDTTGQYYAEYQHQGKVYKNWLENKNSIKEKMKVIMKEDVAGVGEWRLGYESTNVWPVINDALAGKLQ